VCHRGSRDRVVWLDRQYLWLMTGYKYVSVLTGFWRERTELQLSGVEIRGKSSRTKHPFKYPVCNRENINYAFTLSAIQHWISCDCGGSSPHYLFSLYTFLLPLTFIFISLDYSKIKKCYFVNGIVTWAFIKYRPNAIHRIFVSLLLCFMLRLSCSMFCIRKSILLPKRWGLQGDSGGIVGVKWSDKTDLHISYHT
jgi:hypothetical protein